MSAKGGKRTRRRYHRVMSETTVRTLRLGFHGNDLDPMTLTQMLGGSPTQAGRMGDVITQGRGAAKTGFWELRENVGDDPVDLDRAIGRLLGGLTDRLDVWAHILERFGGGLIYSVSAPRPVDGTGLNRQSIKALADRGLSLSVAFYQAGS